MKISSGKQDSLKNYISSSFEAHVADDRDIRSRRRTKRAAAAAGRRGRGGGGPVTPLLKWKFHGGDSLLSVVGGEAPVTGGRGLRRVKRDDTVAVSARKLGAGLWRLVARVNTTTGVSGGDGVRWQWRHLDWFGVELHSSPQISISAMEGALTWNPCSLSTNIRCFCGHSKPFENHQIETISVASALQVQLVQAQRCLQVLEAERQLSKKKLKHFLRKLSEERASWLRREHQKIHALKDELERERRNRQKMDIVSTNLLSDLADAKILVKGFMHKYEKERKARVLLEDVCNELAKEITKDKAEIEALKSECSRIQQEVEDERRMLQMAEVWREERVQMKLVDARLVLEEKYCEMNNIIADLETLSRSKSIGLDMMSEAKAIKKVVKSVNIQEMEEFSYTPPKSDDIYGIIEDLIGNEAKDGEVVQCLGNSPGSHASEIQIASPERNGIVSNTVHEHPNSFTNYDETSRDASGRETVTCVEDLRSSYTPSGTERSVNRISRESHISSGRTEHELIADQDSLISQTSEISSVSVKQSKMKGTSGYKLLRSLPSKDDGHMIIPTDENVRLPNASASNIGATSPGRVSVKSAHDHNDLGLQCCSPGPKNPHITRAMRGCIEWPRVIQRSGLKAKLLEARLASQRTQLQSILKQKS